MTLQEIFDTSAKHLLTQGVAARNENGVCLYRGPNDTKCAVGALIKDEFYSPEMEDIGILNCMPLMSKSDRLLSELAPQARRREILIRGLRSSGVDLYERNVGELLYKLQSVHDTFNPDDWRERLHRVAEIFGLNTKVLDI